MARPYCYQILILSLIFGQVICQECRDDWDSGYGRCFLFRDDMKANWKNSYINCATNQSELLKIDNQKVKGLVMTKLNAMVEKKYWWTGLHREDQIDCLPAFRWIGHSPADFTGLVKWNREPNNWDGSENCGEIFKNGVYNMNNCNRKLGYICRYELPLGQLDCLWGWFKRGKYCFYFSPRIISETYTWNGARDRCQRILDDANVSARGDLVSLLDTKEKEFIKEYVSKFWSIRSHEFGWWTGLNDLPDGRSGYKWLDMRNNVLPGMIDWNREPNNFGLNNQQCASMYYDGAYHDQNCWNKFRYICSRVADTCPNGWQSTGGSPNTCIHFSGDDMKTWEDAAEECFRYGSLLLTVEDQATKTFIERTIHSTGYYVHWWTGLHDRDQDIRCHRWHWADESNVNWNFVQWNREPNNWDGREHCGELSKNGVYTDNNCEAKSGYICKYKLKSNETECPMVASLWISWKGSCYQWGRRDEGDRLTWAEARLMCKQERIDADLLWVESEDEKEYIRDMVGMLTLRKHYFVGWWTSLTDLPESNPQVWRWAATGDVAYPNLIDWNQEPNMFGSDSYCAGIYYDGTFTTHGCDYMLPSICYTKKDNVPRRSSASTMSAVSQLILMTCTILLI